jgi:signal transduction histidine kinase
MRRVRVWFVIVALALAAPIAFLVQRALHSAELERQMRHQAIAERMFDEMERGLSRVLEREEQRPFDHYGVEMQPAAWPFVRGYFQIDPDGSVRTMPIPGADQPVADAGAALTRTVGAYWRGGRAPADVREGAAAQLPGTTVDLNERAQPAASAREPRKDAVADKAVSAFDALRSLNRGAVERAERQKKEADEYGASVASGANGLTLGTGKLAKPRPSQTAELRDSADAEIELPPMVGRLIDERQLMLYRTIVHDTRGYRQGVLLDVGPLGDWLREQGLGADGLADYARVTFTTPFGSPSATDGGAFVYQHRFAEPFDGLTARLALRPLPSVGSGTYVYALAAMAVATGGLGLLALYRMVALAVSFAERRSNFVAAVSHELKTPLTAIRMYAEMLRDGMVPSQSKRDEYYRHITVESERLSRLINNVLEFSRLEKGSREMALVTGSVTPVVHEVAGLLRPHVEGQGFDLRVDLDGALAPVRFEPDALMQVLWNLVDNAVKYAHGATTRQIALRGWEDGAGVHLAVRDHGPGVPARHLAKIFEPFYRGESELTRRSKGTGLGLALVRGLADRMGARVSGRNAPGGGFEVEIAFRPV